LSTAEESRGGELDTIIAERGVVRRLNRAHVELWSTITGDRSARTSPRSAADLIKEVTGVRVIYDVTNTPPGTIERE